MSEFDLVSLVRRVFQPTAADRSLGVMVDLPDDTRPDHAAWTDRRCLAVAWAQTLHRERGRLGLDRVDLMLLRNVHSNNADFPPGCWRFDAAGILGTDDVGCGLPTSAAQLGESAQAAMDSTLADLDILLALTEYSATAPLKLAARRHGFRAASMPHFSPAMIPALGLDWIEVDRRCRHLKSLVDSAETAQVRFCVLAGPSAGDYELRIDLRHRIGHASGGLIRQRGTAGNLPSGETFIVPYEGEIEGDPSRSEGILPVQLASDPGAHDDAISEVVLYRIAANRAVEVLSRGPRSRRESAHLTAEPAYGNLAELGLGVLSAWGVEPVGEILLDEKLGLHIAFGRSDHFGGQIGAADFSSAEAVVHIDRVYLPATQPEVAVPSVDLWRTDGQRVELMRDGAYVIDWP